MIAYKFYVQIFIAVLNLLVGTWKQCKHLRTGKMIRWFMVHPQVKMQWPLSVWSLEMAVISYPHKAVLMKVGKIWSHRAIGYSCGWEALTGWWLRAELCSVVLPRRQPVLYQMGIECKQNMRVVLTKFHKIWEVKKHICGTPFSEGSGNGGRPSAYLRQPCSFLTEKALGHFWWCLLGNSRAGWGSRVMGVWSVQQNHEITC